MSAVGLKAWFLLFRPWSYAATLVPFFVAAGIAWAACPCAVTPCWGRWWIGLACGLFFQATVNLLNTWGDERSGVDAVPGAVRTTPQVHDGLVTMRELFAVAAACAVAAAVTGIGLCFFRDGGAWRFDAPLFVAGLVGFLGATNYSTGVKFKYRGLGVPFVAFLMGPLEVFVAVELLRPAFALPATVADWGMFALFTLPVALLVCVIMHGNDMRDIPTDRAAGIMTPATMLGPRGSLVLYWFCHLAPYTACAALCVLGATFWLALPFLVLPLTVRTLRAATAVFLAADGGNPPWRGLERASGGIHLVFGALYAVAIACAGGV